MTQLAQKRITSGWLIAIGSTLFCAYWFFVVINIPPIVKSNNLSVNRNMLFISSAGIFYSAAFLFSLLLRQVRQYLGNCR